MSGPVPSRLIFLSDLPNRSPGDKVRLLGCVEHYDPSLGSMSLKHNYPSSSIPVVAKVHLDHVLESITPTTIQIGTWLNVVGFISRNEDTEHKDVQAASNKSSRPMLKVVTVDAVMIWDAGSIKLDAYEKALEARKACGTAG